MLVHSTYWRGVFERAGKKKRGCTVQKGKERGDMNGGIVGKGIVGTLRDGFLTVT